MNNVERWSDLLGPVHSFSRSFNRRENNPFINTKLLAVRMGMF